MDKVMVFGTFDILHEGHLDFFRQSKKHGDYLIVVVSRDSNVLKHKGQQSKHTLNDRIKAIERKSVCDEVIPGYKTDFFKIITENNPKSICIGYDQDDKDIKIWLAKNKMNINVFYLEPYKENEFKSSLLKK